MPADNHQNSGPELRVCLAGWLPFAAAILSPGPTTCHLPAPPSTLAPARQLPRGGGGPNRLESDVVLLLVRPASACFGADAVNALFVASFQGAAAVGCTHAKACFVLVVELMPCGCQAVPLGCRCLAGGPQSGSLPLLHLYAARSLRADLRAEPMVQPTAGPRAGLRSFRSCPAAPAPPHSAKGATSSTLRCVPARKKRPCIMNAPDNYEQAAMQRTNSVGE